MHSRIFYWLLVSMKIDILKLHDIRNNVRNQFLGKNLVWIFTDSTYFLEKLNVYVIVYQMLWS